MNGLKGILDIKRREIIMRKRNLLVAVLAVILLCASVLTAHAGWYTCTITYAGTNSGSVYLLLTDQAGAFTNKWFAAPATSTTIQNQMLAVALTAISLEKKIYIFSADITPSPAMSGAFYIVN